MATLWNNSALTNQAIIFNCRAINDTPLFNNAVVSYTYWSVTRKDSRIQHNIVAYMSLMTYFYRFYVTFKFVQESFLTTNGRSKPN